MGYSSSTVAGCTSTDGKRTSTVAGCASTDGGRRFDMGRNWNYRGRKELWKAARENDGRATTEPLPLDKYNPEHIYNADMAVPFPPVSDEGLKVACASVETVGSQTER